METGIENYSIPEPVFIRPPREQEEITSYYGWDDMMKEEEAERDWEERRAALPYYMGVNVDLLA